jgi:hypothetical protein
MNLEFGMDYNAKVAMALELVKGQMQVVSIEAYGLVHQHMGRDYFLKHYYRDVLQEEFVMVSKFLKIAMHKDQNDPQALQTLEKVIEMKLSELKSKTMAELVEMHNELAEAVDKKPVTKFKSLEAGRIAVVALSNVKPKTAAAKAPKEGGGVEGRKRTGVGKRAKELLVANGGDTQEVFEQIREEFPDNSTTKPCIAYYKNALVKAGLLPGGRTKKAEVEEAAPVEAKKLKKPKSKSKKVEANDEC